MTTTSITVKRFDLNIDSHGCPRIEEIGLGDFILYSDYAALSDQIAEEIRVSNLRGNHIEFELLPQMADLSAQLEEWKEAAQRHHPNPADYRYWEGRYRDEKSQLEAANARADRARDDALVEVTARLGSLKENSPCYIPHSEMWEHQRDAIQALRTQPTPSAEPVTVQGAARVLLHNIDAIHAMAAVMRNNPCTLYEVQVTEALGAIAGEKP